jgi:hypothetical protein
MPCEKKNVFKIYLRVCPTEHAHSKEITISFEQKPVTAADIWKENLFQFYIIWGSKDNICLDITITFFSILSRIILIYLLYFPNLILKLCAFIGVISGTTVF